MRPEDLYDAFHEIDDDLLKPLPEAAPRRHPALRWGALAACALLAAGGLLWLRPWEKTAPQSSLAVPTLASEPTANESTAASDPAIPEPAELVYGTELFAAAAGGLFHPHAVRGAAGLHLGAGDALADGRGERGHL